MHYAVMTTNFSLRGISAHKYHHSVDWKRTNDNLAAEPLIDGMHAGKVSNYKSFSLHNTGKGNLHVRAIIDMRLVHAMVSRFYQAA